MDDPGIDGRSDRPADQSLGYPAEIESDQPILDGSVVHVRPIRPSDAPGLVRFHDALSPATQYRRFFTAHPHLSEREVERFTTLDYHDRLAIVAEADGRLIGIARYDRLSELDLAEVAFVVADDWQHHGVGTMLLAQLAKAAQGRGIRRFVADTMVDNLPMIAVFEESGFTVHLRNDAGILHVWFTIDEGDEAGAAVPPGGQPC